MSHERVNTTGSFGRASRGLLLALVCLFGSALSVPARAQDSLPSIDGFPLEAMGGQVLEAPEDDLLADFAVVGDSELAEIRGGEGSVLSLQDLEAVVSGNTVRGTVTTGDSTIGGNAFSNLDGISSVVVNTGNNVSIQSSTVVNVVIED